MSSALAALSPEERAEVLEDAQYRRLERAMTERGLERLLSFELIREVVIPSPAAGAEWSTQPPSGVTWEPVTVTAALTTSAVVANRVGNLQVLNADGNRMALTDSLLLEVASQVGIYTWSSSVMSGYASQGLKITLPLPAEVVLPGYSLGSNTNNLDVNDQWSAIRLLVREWSPSRVVHLARSLLIDLDSAGGIY